MIEDANQLRVTMQQMRRLLWALADLKEQVLSQDQGYLPPWPKHLWKTWIA